MGNISIWQLLIVLALVILLFGTKRLRTLGGDLGSALKGFRSAMDNKDEGDDDKLKTENINQSSATAQSGNPHQTTETKQDKS